MASSSPSSHSVPASISQSWSYDVFLSFRGEDTRKNFVGHLYTALEQQGIYTYKDDETLDRGERIGPTLLKAIQESQIAVIVFSKNYADSSWCLDELAHIIECMDTRGQIVMPIFYHVDPSDVRKQNGKYGEAFTKHQGGNKHKVESWRKALEKAGSISGWTINDFENSHEAKCIKDIVHTISNRLSPLTTDVNKDLIGIETRLQDLKSKLEIGSGGVRMVGIWGVGGGGKTTLASAAYMEISHLFEAACLLENIREESSKHGLTKLQEKFLSLALKTNEMVGSEIEGRSIIKKRLCHKSVLVVLDDIDNREQLEALAGSYDWFGKGSRIIITTRDEHLLNLHTKMIYEVSLLSHDEAMKLFSRHAFRKENPVEDYEKLSQDVVSYAGGLPLALEVLGSFLYDKDKDEWKCALAKLKDIPDDKVMKTLRISYDGLEDYQQELFLDIACFLRRWDIDDAMTMLDACSFHPRTGVKVLVQKSLIKVTNREFDMHDLVQEMAHYIVRESPKKYCRIWKDEDIDKLCAMEATSSLMLTHEVEVLASAGRDSRLPDVVANMKNLRCIDLYWFPESPFSSNFQPTNLGYLCLLQSEQKELWQGYKLLPNLKVLCLVESTKLIKTPDFDGLPCLERLNLTYCQELKEIHPSIGYHERLVCVEIHGCSRLKTFPPIIRMKKLETLLLFYCHLQKFPDIQSNMDSLVYLVLRFTGIEVIPPSVGQFCTNLVSFHLRGCTELKRIEGNFRLLKRLKHLHLEGCSQLLSQHSTSFRNLMKCISLQSSHQHRSLSLKLPQFPRFLMILNLGRCNLGDGDIPSDISELLNLQILYLNDNRFSRLHSGLSRIPGLKFLNLSRCRSLVELPDLPSSIAILIADYCDSLERVGDLLNYKWLWKVSIWGRYNLIGAERVLHSMLERNVVEDRFMSVRLPNEGTVTTDGKRTLITLQLPHNWCSDFSGFLLSADDFQSDTCTIVIKQVMLSMDSQPDYDHWKEFDKHLESYEGYVGYVPFSSLRHTSWWNPMYTNISFQIDGMMSNLKVGLVPKISKIDDLNERPIDYSKCWDEVYEDRKTFEIIDDSKSSNIQIVWNHDIEYL